MSTVEGGCTMCSVGGVWGELVCTGMSSDWRLPSTWFWVGVFWRSEQKAVTKCKHKSQDCLKVPGCENQTTHAGRADTDVAHSRGVRARTCGGGCVQKARRHQQQSYLEEEIVPSSIHFAAQRRRRLCSQLVVDAEQGSLRMARIGRWSKSGQSACRTKSVAAPRIPPGKCF